MSGNNPKEEGDSNREGREVRGFLTEYDKQHLSTISSSISRARALLMTISLIAAWLLASQLIDLLRWQKMRTPASLNIVNAADGVLKERKVTVPVREVRASDIVNMLRDGVQLYDSAGRPLEDTVTVPYPGEGASFADKVNWCQHYYEFILAQWRSPCCSDSATLGSDDTNRVAPHARSRDATDVDVISLVRVIVDRGEIAQDILTKDVVKRPVEAVPIFGLTVNRDDINIVGAFILMFAMIWFRFAANQVKENIAGFLKQVPVRSGKRRFLSSFLPMQFLFIKGPTPSRDSEPHVKSEISVYYLFFVPYLVVLFSLLVSIHDMFWQTEAYSRATGSFAGTPFMLERRLIGLDMAGILALRWATLVGIAVFLAREAWISWRTMHQISTALIQGGRRPTGDSPASGHVRQASALIAITAAPILAMAVWTYARCKSVEKSLEFYGWSYGPTLNASLAILATVALLLIGLYFIWPLLRSRSSRAAESEPSPDSTPDADPPANS